MTYEEMNDRRARQQPLDLTEFCGKCGRELCRHNDRLCEQGPRGSGSPRQVSDSGVEVANGKQD